MIQLLHLTRDGFPERHEGEEKRGKKGNCGKERENKCCIPPPAQKKCGQVIGNPLVPPPKFEAPLLLK